MSENDQEKKEVKFLVAPEWGAELGKVIQILGNEFSDIGDSKFTFVDENNSNIAKVETKLGDKYVLVTSCLGKNEIRNCLVFKLFIASNSEDIQPHKEDSSFDVELDKDGKILTSLVFRKLGNSLNELLKKFKENELDDLDSEDKKK